MYFRGLTSVLVLSLGFMAQACAVVADGDVSDDGAESLELAGPADESGQDIDSLVAESGEIEPQSERPGCQLFANRPQLMFDSGLNKWVFWAEGGREGCEQFRPRITVKIREDIPILPDEDFVSKDFSGVNIDVSVQGVCASPLDDATYFTEVSTNAGGKQSSAHVHLDCPGPN